MHCTGSMAFTMQRNMRCALQALLSSRPCTERDVDWQSHCMERNKNDVVCGLAGMSLKHSFKQKENNRSLLFGAPNIKYYGQVRHWRRCTYGVAPHFGKYRCTHSGPRRWNRYALYDSCTMGRTSCSGMYCQLQIMPGNCTCMGWMS